VTTGADGPLAGEPRERQPTGSVTRRVAGWLAWWVPLMSLWVALDDSLATDELLAGAGAAAIAALLAEMACHQAALLFRFRLAWLLPALRLPGQVALDTMTVYHALWRKLAHGEDPRGGFTEEQVRPGRNDSEGTLRRALIIGGRSLAPNTFVLGIDAERDVMVVHRLVGRRRAPHEGD
jgi:multisubunit Na+/H+ antiporter MnhE subunit